MPRHRVSKGVLKEEARHRWMRAFYDIVTSRDPGLAGRIDWNTPTYLYLSGLDYSAAAEKYLQRRREQGSEEEE